MRIYVALFLICLLLISCSQPPARSLNVLLIRNSASPDFRKSKDFIIPYLDHWGVPYRMIDLNEQIPLTLPEASLLIIAHPRMDYHLNDPENLQHRIIAAVQQGKGVVSFDPLFPHGFMQIQESLPDSFTQIRFERPLHYITALHEQEETRSLFSPMISPAFQSLKGEKLLSCGTRSVLSVFAEGQGRLAFWTSMEWMNSKILGPLAGLDDCLWRSLVWAAQKPFVLQGLMPMVAMRVDDVAGRGEIWNSTPLYWVKAAIEFGFKPWLGLFIYNLTPQAVDELRDILLAGQATASPHAFGRPPRQSPAVQISSYTAAEQTDDLPFYYDPQAFPLRAETYDEFIYFDHHQNQPWSDEEAHRGLRAVDEWYAAHQPLPMSSCFVPHWYEFGLNVVPHVADVWRMQFVLTPKDVDLPYQAPTPWLSGKPFRCRETPKSSLITRPVYYADFVEFAGRRLFNCLTEIRDDAGYEWAPDNDVQATVGRGVRQLKRALSSMALPVLFTHETDYIYRIQPENWRAELQAISEEIRSLDPKFVTLDEACKQVRAVYTSYIASAQLVGDKKLLLQMEGAADVPTTCAVFIENTNGIHQHLIPIPAFTDKKRLQVLLNDD